MDTSHPPLPDYVESILRGMTSAGLLNLAVEFLDLTLSAAPALPVDDWTLRDYIRELRGVVRVRYSGFVSDDDTQTSRQLAQMLDRDLQLYKAGFLPKAALLLAQGVVNAKDKASIRAGISACFAELEKRSIAGFPIFNEALRRLTPVAEAVVNVGEPGDDHKLASQSEQLAPSTALVFFIDPGNANENDIRAIFAALNKLHLVAGGQGFHFSIERGDVLAPDGNAV
jgi:hypothetical protein